MRASPLIASSLIASPQVGTADPAPLVDERLVRTVAALTVGVALAVLATGWWALLVPLVPDFAARAAGRPRWSLLTRLSRAAVLPRLGGSPRAVPAQPKRFAAGIGAGLTASALVTGVVWGVAGTAPPAGTGAGWWAATALVVALAAAAAAEAAFGFCIGCRLHAGLVRLGVLADDCPECRDLSRRRRPPASLTDTGTATSRR